MSDMFNPDTRFTKEFTVSSYDVDAKKQASLQSICRYLQEMATLHAMKLKLGFEDMIKDNRAWVLAQMLVRLEKLPAFHEDFSITTWSNGPDGRFALRDFEIRDAGNRLIGGASSTWFVIDIAEKKICRLDGYFEGYQYDNIAFALGRKPQRIKPSPNPEFEEKIQVHYSDLDINGHVNNVRYMDFLLDMFTAEFRAEHNIYEIEMNFLREARLGDTLNTSLVRGRDEKEYFHSIINDNTGTPCFSARTRWH